MLNCRALMELYLVLANQKVNILNTSHIHTYKYYEYCRIIILGELL